MKFIPGDIIKIKENTPQLATGYDFRGHEAAILKGTVTQGDASYAITLGAHKSLAWIREKNLQMVEPAHVGEFREKIRQWLKI
jgi:hypothetical protein